MLRSARIDNGGRGTLPFSHRLLSPIVRRIYADRLPEQHYSETVWQNGFVSARRMLDRLPGLDLEGLDILDVGCGTGNLSILAAQHRARSVRAFDFDPAMVRIGQKKLNAEYSELASRVQFHVADDLNGLPEAAFDLVFSKDCFEHYAEPERMLAQMQRCLRPDGRVVIGFGPLWCAPLGGPSRHPIALGAPHLPGGASHARVAALAAQQRRVAAA